MSDAVPAAGFAVTPRVLLVNRNAGRVDDAAIGTVCRLLGATGPLEVVVTSHPEEAEPAIRAVGGRTLVVVGGDGTIHDAVTRLDRASLLADTTVALVPLGTANALARGLRLPLDTVDACRVVAHGRPRAIDLLEAGDRIVLNDVHTGFGVVKQGRVAAAKKLTGRFAYPVVNAATALTTDGWRMRVEVDGAVLVDEGRLSLAVGVGNGPVIGNGTELWPSPDMSDGRLDVVVALAGRSVDRLALGLAVARTHHIGRHDVRAATGRAVHITGGPGAHNADGEVWHGVDAATYRVRRSAWCLITDRR